MSLIHADPKRNFPNSIGVLGSTCCVTMPSADSSGFNSKDMYYLTLQVRWHYVRVDCIKGPDFFLFLCVTILRVCFIQRHSSSWSHSPDDFQWQLGCVLPCPHLTGGRKTERNQIPSWSHGWDSVRKEEGLNATLNGKLLVSFYLRRIR